MLHKYLSVLLLFSGSSIFSQNSQINIQLRYQIAPVYNFKNSIFSITFDDGGRDNFERIVPLLNERNIPGTFYINTMKFDSYYCKMITDADLTIHEVGSHTVNHLHLNKISSNETRRELTLSRQAIDDLIKPKTCLTMSYPYGAYNLATKEIASELYLGARSLDGGLNDFFNLNKYALKCASFGIVSLNYLNQSIRMLPNSNAWFIELFHGIDSTAWEPINEVDLIKHLDLVKSKEKYVWFASVANVLKYIEESKKATINCENCNYDSFSFRIEDNLTDSIYDHPLSVLMKIPIIWSDSLTIINAQYVRVVTQNSEKYLLFNAIPNGDVITISPKTILPSENIESIIISPIFFNDFVDIEINKSDNPIVEVYDIKGNLIKLNYTDITEEYSYVTINTSSFAKGIYIIKVITGTSIITKKIIKY